MRPPLLISAVVWALVAGASRQADAQAIRGRVLAAESAVPVPGALVIAWSTAGDTVRALSSSVGRFLLRLPRAGDDHLRVMRMGFAPSPAIAVSVADRAEVVQDLNASAIPVRLEAVAVRHTAVCGRMTPEASREAAVIARIWEDARSAMFATQLEVDGEALNAEWMEYERETDTTGRIVRTQQLRVVRQPTRQVFRSTAPERLIEQGFVTLSDSVVQYAAPDPEVLLSSEFTTTHCFPLEPGSGQADEGSLGLRFEPAASRAHLRDIAGVIRMDKATGLLQRLSFTYTNMPDIPGIRAGGDVEFRRLPSGRWVVDRWYAQVPLVQRRRGATVRGLSGFRGEDQWVAVGLHATGGEVIRLEQAGTDVLVRDVPQVRLALVYRDTLVDLEGADVTLEGTNLRGTTDHQGFVELRRSGGAIVAIASRGNAPSLQSGAAPCPFRVLINGVALPPRGNDGVDLSDLPRPEAIERVDVYPSGAEVPVSLASSARGSWCGLIAFRTR